MTPNLNTAYLGLQLKNPLVIAACPLCQELDTLQRLAAAGAAAAVLPSLFEEQIEHDDLAMSEVQDFGTETFAESLSYFPDPGDYRCGPKAYLDYIGEAKSVVSIPIIGSLNGTSQGGWTGYAEQIQDAGADALELNIFHIATDPEKTGQEVETQCLEVVEAVRRSISIPLAVKIGPYFSAMGNMAKRLVDAGADGLVLFNRFIQPDIDLNEMETSPRLTLSNPSELLVPLRWIAILRGHLSASLAATGGIHDAEGLIKALAVGADVGMMASAIYRGKRIELVAEILNDLSVWLRDHEYESVEQLRGCMSRENCPNPDAFSRGNYMKALTDYTGPAI